MTDVVGNVCRALLDGQGVPGGAAAHQHVRLQRDQVQPHGAHQKQGRGAGEARGPECLPIHVIILVESPY